MRGILDWFIRNPVAANLLTLLIVVGGLLSMGKLNNEFFPHVEPGYVRVSVPYPGAGPLEVEEQICIKIEEAIADVEGIKEVTSTASQGMGQVQIEMADGWDLQRLIGDIKTRVDAISTFPANAERPIVANLTMQREVLQVVVYGGDDEERIKEVTLDLKERINRLPGVSQVDISGVRNYLVAVEVDEETLRAYGLNFRDIANAINNSSLNLPAGQMRNPDGDIQIQVYGQDYRAGDFENIVVVKSGDGARVTLGDIATIKDTFEEKNFLVEYEDRLAARLSVKVGENPDTIGTADTVRDFLAHYEMADGFAARVWSDNSYFLKDRLNLLAENSLLGLALVFTLLLLFLRPALAVWVSVGIAVAILGTIMLMPVTNTTINVVSTFAFLLILGILVDDSIVVSESIYANYERGLPGPQAASRGVNGVAKPVILSVVTTLMVFVPMLFAPGTMTDVFKPVPVVALIALCFSLVEALLILPSHLSHLRPERESSNVVMAAIARARGYTTRKLNWFSIQVYQPLLARSLQRKGATVAFFVAMLMVTLSLLAGGWVSTRFMPAFEDEVMIAQARLQEGAGFARVLAVERQIEAGLQSLRDNPEARGNRGQSAIRDSFASVDGNLVTMEVNLIGNGERKITTAELQALWKEAIGEVTGVESFTVSASIFGFPRDISLRLSGADIHELRDAATALKAMLGNYTGVVDISDSLATARQEVRIDLKPHGETLGLELRDVAQQVRHAFYGAEAQRIPRLREDVRVMVRYPVAERGSIESLVNMRIKLADGTLVPFSEVAEATFIPGYTTIVRTDRIRIVDVFADIVPGRANATEIVQDIMKNGRPQLLAEYSGVNLALEGDHLEMGAFITGLAMGMVLAVFAMYALLAVEFKSYLQPLYILSAVPFGIAGAVIGHLVMGLEFSTPSGFGVLATAGVVVNSNLVLIDRINGLREEGLAIVEAVLQGARERLRPILLTSITTFFGLMPIVLEESPSATPLIPLAVSLSFGVVFAATVTLLMVPAVYASLETLKQRLGFAARASVELA